MYSRLRLLYPFTIVRLFSCLFVSYYCFFPCKLGGAFEVFYFKSVLHHQHHRSSIIIIITILPDLVSKLQRDYYVCIEALQASLDSSVVSAVARPASASRPAHPQPHQGAARRAALLASHPHPTFRDAGPVIPSARHPVIRSYPKAAKRLSLRLPGPNRPNIPHWKGGKRR